MHHRMLLQCASPVFLIMALEDTTCTGILPLVFLTDLKGGRSEQVNALNPS